MGNANKSPNMPCSAMHAV